MYMHTKLIPKGNIHLVAITEFKLEMFCSKANTPCFKINLTFSVELTLFSKTEYSPDRAV
jgi:hypothetical protein